MTHVSDNSKSGHYADILVYQSQALVHVAVGKGTVCSR